MSDASIQFRKPTSAETRLLAAMLRQAKCAFPVEICSVASLRDGGMGSLALCFRGHEGATKLFSSILAEMTFKDVDEVDVVVSLNANKDLIPIELDIWKTDFSPLKEVPSTIY